MKYRKPIGENNYLCINHINNTRKNLLQLHIRNNHKKSYPVTHATSTMPNDINLSDIFSQMLKISNEIYENKNNSFYIKLSQEQAFQRKMVLESIKSFVSQNQIKNKILYNIIFLFDLLMAKNEKKKLTNIPEKLGLGSTILTIKFYYEGNRIITMKRYRSVFKNRYYFSRDIKEIELLCLYLCDYNLTFPSPIAFMEVFLLNRIISYQDDIKKESKKRINNLIMNTLEKIIYESNEYIKYNPLYLCCCIIYYIREIYGLEKWPRILSNLFNTNIQAFEVVYNEYFKTNKNKESNKNNNYDSCNNNNVSTNIDSHGNCSSNRNIKNKKITEINIKNQIFNDANNFYKEKEKEYNFQKISIKKINLHINNGIINNVLNSEKKLRKNTNSVDFINGKRGKENTDRQEEKNYIYKNKSNLENIINNNQKPIYYNYEYHNNELLSYNNIDNYNNYKENKNYNIINNNNELQNTIKTIYFNNFNLQTITKNDIFKEKDNEKSKIKVKVKEPIKNIRVSLKPFLRKINIKSINKNLDKFINTESSMNQFLMKKDNSKYKQNNNITTNKNENLIDKNNEIFNSISANNNNLNKKNNNKYKRYSSCDRCYGEIKSYIYNDTYENEFRKNNKNFSIRRNYCNIKKLDENLNKKPNEIFDENDSLVKDSILNKDNYLKNRDHIVSKSIEAFPMSNIRIYNLNRYTHNIKTNNKLNTIMFEKGKYERKQNNEQSDNIPKTGKKVENLKNYRLNSIERFYESKKYKSGIELNHEDSEIPKYSNIRNYYKQKNASINKLFDKSTNIIL